VVRGPVAFFSVQAAFLNPITLPLWAAGLAWVFFSPAGKRWRVLGWTYLVMLVIFIALHGKNYYLVPAYPMLFAAGAVAFEHVSEERWRWSRVAYAGLIVVAGVALAPLSAPVLQPASYIRYQQKLGGAQSCGNQKTGPLPQYFADEFGGRT